MGKSGLATTAVVCLCIFLFLEGKMWFLLEREKSAPLPSTLRHPIQSIHPRPPIHPIPLQCTHLVPTIATVLPSGIDSESPFKTGHKGRVG